MKPKHLRSWLRHIRVLSDVPISRHWYKTVSKFCLRFVVLNRSYSTNTQPIWKQLYPRRSLRNSSLLLLVLECNNFSFLTDTIDNIIYACGTCHQNFNQWQCSIIVTCLSLCITWPVYITAIGGSSGQVMRTHILHMYVLV